MPPYFKPLRRKFGVVTLGLACACAVCWLRWSIILAATPVTELLEREILLTGCRVVLVSCAFLTVVSADLLLSRPRTPKPVPPVDENAPLNGYFKPLRRKIGVLTLGLACVFVAGWFRSYSVWDSTFLVVGYSCSFDSFDGRAIWGIRQHPDQKSGVFGWDAHWLSGSRLSETRKLLKEGAEWQWRFYGFGSANFPKGQPTNLQSVLWVTPYWSIVLPLTLLSAWLLLSRPRANKAFPPVAENSK